MINDTTNRSTALLALILVGCGGPAFDAAAQLRQGDPFADTGPVPAPDGAGVGDAGGEAAADETDGQTLDVAPDAIAPLDASDAAEVTEDGPGPDVEGRDGRARDAGRDVGPDAPPEVGAGDASDGDSCPIHSDGLGQSYASCDPTGTDSYADAQLACSAWSVANGADPGRCVELQCDDDGGILLGIAICAEAPGSGVYSYCWTYFATYQGRVAAGWCGWGVPWT